MGPDEIILILIFSVGEEGGLFYLIHDPFDAVCEFRVSVTKG